MTSTSHDSISDPLPQSEEQRKPAEETHADDRATEQARKANLLHRVISRVIDLLIALAFYHVIPSVGFWFGLVYLFIADGFWSGQSVGKKLLGLKVVRHGSGDRISFKESIVRNFSIIIGFFLFPIPFIGWLFLAVILALEFLMMLGSDQGRRIGDELAGTLVMDVPLEDKTKEHTTDGI